MPEPKHSMQDDIEQQQVLLTTYRRTLAHWLAQAAQYGGVPFAPPQVANGIYEARQNIERIKSALRDLGIEVKDHVDDQAIQPRVAQSPSAEANASGRVLSGIVRDSGAWVLLGDRFFTSEAVLEGSDNTIVMHLITHRPEDEAFLRSVQTQHRAHHSIAYAHANDADFVQVQDVQSKSASGQIVWTVIVRKDRNAQGGIFSEASINGVTPDQQAEMRARLLLLNEPLVKGQGPQDKMLASWIAGRHTQVSITEDMLLQLWQRLHGQQGMFLPWARLWAVFHLKATLTCEHILELTLGPIANGILDIHFRGQRQQFYTNQEPTIIEVKGQCILG